MPHTLRPGTIKNGYKIIKILNRGVFAIAYEAISKSGKLVFLKQYRLPNPSMEWFTNFVNHQFEIKQCIESDRIASNQFYRFIEFFVENGFYQVFEFVDGKSLTHLLTDIL